MIITLVVSVLLLLIPIVFAGLNYKTRLESLSIKELLKLESILLGLGIMVFIITVFSNLGDFHNPHGGAMAVIFIIMPLLLVLSLGEIIIALIIRNKFNTIKAIIITLSSGLFLTFI